MLVAFYLIPHAQYANEASIGVLDSSLTSTLSIPTLPSLLGFSKPVIDENLKYLQFPLIATLLFVIGALLSFLRHRERSEIYLVAILALACAFIVQLQLIEPRTGVGLHTLLNPLPWLLMLTVFIPLGGAWGAFTLVSTIINLRSTQRKGQIDTQNTLSTTGLRGMLSSALTFFMVGSLIALVPTGSGYGPLVESGQRKGLLQELISIEWNGFELNNVAPRIIGENKLVSLLHQKKFMRIDVSPHLEDVGSQILNISNASHIVAEPDDLSLIKPGWEYQRNVFYSSDLGIDEQGNVDSLINSAYYFGVEYVFLDMHQDQQDIYKDAGWDLIVQEDNVQLWHSPGNESLATHSSRPAILVPEKPGREIFMTVFRLANDGFLPYEEACLIEGRERIDHYRLEDLLHFDVIFLIGYDYRNRSKAWDTLAAYVEHGGSLYLDTGWQFAVAEWEFEQAPDVIPVSRLSWTDYGMVDRYELGALDIAGDVDIGEFKPLRWEGGPWAVSGTESSDIRNWGRTVLSANGRPLIVAGEYGSGKVVWSGMNLIGHALYLGENQEELKLLHNIVNWLLEENKGSELDLPSIEREYPDNVVFTLSALPEETTWLYWREAYYPNWHAYLLDDSGEWEIPIYRGGPGFMIMPIETSSEEVSVTLRWESSFMESASIVVSILGVIFLIWIAIDGLFLDGQGLTWLKIAFTMRLPRPFLDEETHRGVQKKPLRVKDILPGYKEKDHESEEGSFDANSFEISLNDEQESLLKSLLNDKEDEGDPWVNKMLDPDQRK
jgi:hypothetical protein